MGTYLTKIINSLSAKKEMKILMAGLDNAGKTTILYQLKLNESINTIPTIGFNVETVQYKNLQFTIWDICGPIGVKSNWSYYHSGINAIIYVLDSEDKWRLQQAKEALERLINSSEIRGVPILVYANKQDIATLKTEYISEYLNIGQNQGVGQWYIQGCCAANGKELYEGLDWLSKALSKQQK